MATNFFEHQDKARKKTGLLIVCFATGLLLMTAVLYAVGMIIFNAVESQQNEGHRAIEIVYWNAAVLGGIFLLVLVVVGGSSLFKIMALRSGGKVVAEMVGATPLDPSTRNHAERIALNVVEEMAIASGSPVPPVYIMESQSINAFAAGWSPNDAIVALNRGTIEKLDRDELQGVVAHEFSHILNGDMRISIRLIGVIHGLLVLGITGWFMLRIVGPAMLGSGRRSSSKDGGGGGIGVAIILFGLALMLCGFIGTFFGRLVQAAISRQREFLADASAVQFTRNPDGIGGALRKIQLVGAASPEEVSEKASEINHMFFCMAVTSIFATHPPLTERIARVEGLPIREVKKQLGEARQRNRAAAKAEPVAVAASTSGEVDRRKAAGDILGAVILSSVLSESTGRVGTIDQAGLDQSRSILDAIPQPLKEAAHSTTTARLVVLLLLQDEDQSDRDLQWKTMSKELSSHEYQAVKTLAPSMEQLDSWARLPLLDLCIPSLSQMSESQYREFRDLVDRLINIDGQVDRWEWVVDTVLDRHLEERYHKPGAERRARGKLTAHKSAAECVLATLAFLGADTNADAEAAFQAGIKVLGWNAMLPASKTLGLRALRQALKELRIVTFVQRGTFLSACEQCILTDGKTTIEEAETFRAVAESIDCPMPPLRLPSDAASQ